MCKSHRESSRGASPDSPAGCRSRGPSAWPRALPDMAELMSAVKTGDLDFLVKMFSLLPEGEATRVVAYRAPQTRETLLFSASVKGHAELVRFLLALGRGQSALYTVWGAGPLHAAAERCHEAVVRLLIQSGADLNAQTSYGDTPLHLAAYRGHYAIVRCLVEAGCQLNIRNSKGKTALDDATGARHSRIVQYLTAVIYPDIYDRATTSEERKVANDTKVDLMKTRPLMAEPIKTHQRLDRSISWHSCPSSSSSSSNNNNSSSSGRNNGSSINSNSSGNARSVSPTGTETSMNDLSTSPREARSPRWDAQGGMMQSIPEGGGIHPSSAGSQQGPSTNPTQSGTHVQRPDSRRRSASDARVEYLEKMVEYLRLGMTASQEELGRTKVELRRARHLLRSPTRINADVGYEQGPNCY